MAVAEVDYLNGGGGGGTPIINGYYAGTGASTTPLTFSESDYALIALGTNQTYITDEFYVVEKGETKTLESTGTYGTKVVFTFAADGQSASWTKSNGYGSFAFFAISID